MPYTYYEVCNDTLHSMLLQTKLHQKLMDIQHDERMLKLSPRVREGAWEAAVHVSDRCNEEAVSPRSSAIHILNELTKHEMRRSKVVTMLCACISNGSSASPKYPNLNYA